MTPFSGADSGNSMRFICVRKRTPKGTNAELLDKNYLT